MPLYQCFFDRFDGDVREFLVIDADDEACACIKADNLLAAKPSYKAVEVYADDRRIVRIDRAHVASGIF